MRTKPILIVGLVLIFGTLLWQWSWSAPNTAGITVGMNPYNASVLFVKRDGHIAFCIYDKGKEVFELNTYGTLKVGKRIKGLW